MILKNKFLTLNVIKISKKIIKNVDTEKMNIFSFNKLIF